MPLKVNDIDTLREYIDGVMKRARHHAGGVEDIALALVGAIIWRMDPGTIEVMTQGGDTKNVLWVRIDLMRFAFSYNHEDRTIEMREGTTQGPTLRSFDNSTTPKSIREFFAKL